MEKYTVLWIFKWNYGVWGDWWKTLMDLWIFLDTKKTGWCICGTAHTFILQAEDRRNICAQQWVRNVCLVWQWWALKMIFVNIFPIMTSLISLLQRELGRCLSLRTSPLDNVRGYVSLNFNNVCARMLVCFEWRFFFHSQDMSRRASFAGLVHGGRGLKKF